MGNFGGLQLCLPDCKIYKTYIRLKKHGKKISLVITYYVIIFLHTITLFEIRAKRYSQQKVKGRSFRRPSDRLRQLMATAMSRRHVTRMLESGHVTGWSPGRWPGGCAFPGLGSGWGSPWWCGWLPLPPCGTNPSPGGEWRTLSPRMSVCVGLGGGPLERSCGGSPWLSTLLYPPYVWISVNTNYIVITST